MITATGTLGAVLPGSSDQVQAVAIGQPHVGQAQVEVLGLEHSLRGADRARRAGRDSSAQE